ncbi:MAG: hypothetical protein DHS20C15_04030 [Planctomycetota bacterium]|nr:MAG: hypothetical protein DHS20C15_04030 [Planctomycetota bacterium]
MLCVAEAHRGALETAEAFHEDLIGTVDQDVGDSGIPHERRERPHPESFLHEVFGESIPFGGVEREVALLLHATDELRDRVADCLFAFFEHLTFAELFEEALL